MTGPGTDRALFEHDDEENESDIDAEREQIERDNYREAYAEDSEQFYY